MPSAYIESTIPSFYHETRSDRIVQTWRDFTRKWWDDHRHDYELFTSRFVIAELSEIPSAKAASCVELLREVEILDEASKLASVIQYYLKNLVMPRNSLGDAAHLAMASLHKMDFLVTWNCRHLANANKARHIAIVNQRIGLPTPIITTPVMLMPEIDH